MFAGLMSRVGTFAGLPEKRNPNILHFCAPFSRTIVCEGSEKQAATGSLTFMVPDTAWTHGCAINELGHSHCA